MKAWIARDKYGLHLFLNCPLKSNSNWHCSFEKQNEPTEKDLPEGVNPKWSDDEPIEVELKLERID